MRKIGFAPLFTGGLIFGLGALGHAATSTPHAAHGISPAVAQENVLRLRGARRLEAAAWDDISNLRYGEARDNLRQSSRLLDQVDKALSGQASSRAGWEAEHQVSVAVDEDHAALGYLAHGKFHEAVAAIQSAGQAKLSAIEILKGLAGSTPPTTTTTAQPAYQCVGSAVRLLYKWNVKLVGNGGAAPSFGTGGKAYCLVSITTYHWNGGHGQAPGTLGLTVVSGAGAGGTLGPWKATGSPGQNGAPNVNWIAFPPNGSPVILDGTYRCKDSAPATWSKNKASGGLGFCAVFAKPAQ